MEEHLLGMHEDIGSMPSITKPQIKRKVKEREGGKEELSRKWLITHVDTVDCIICHLFI